MSGVRPSSGKASYDLRRLVRKGLLCRALNSQRYSLTPYGWKLARLYARLEARIFRPALRAMNDPPAAPSGRLKQSLTAVDAQFDELISQPFPARQAVSREVERVVEVLAPDDGRQQVHWFGK